MHPPSGSSLPRKRNKKNSTRNKTSRRKQHLRARRLSAAEDIESSYDANELERWPTNQSIKTLSYSTLDDPFSIIAILAIIAMHSYEGR